MYCDFIFIINCVHFLISSVGIIFCMTLSVFEFLWVYHFWQILLYLLLIHTVFLVVSCNQLLQDQTLSANGYIKFVHWSQSAGFSCQSCVVSSDVKQSKLRLLFFYPWPPRAANISWKGNCLWRSFSIMSSHLASPCSLSSSCSKKNIRYKF